MEKGEKEEKKFGISSLGEANNYSDSTNSTENTQLNQRKCELCILMKKDEIASWFCKNCNQYYCENCKNLHEVQKLTKDHKITSAADADNAADTKHKCEPCLALGKEDTAVSYCCDCKEFLCKTCEMLHSFQTISKDHHLKGVDEIEARDTITTLCVPCNRMGKEEVATSYCKECEEYMCDGCTSLHEAQKMTRDHNLCPAEEQLNMPDENTFLCEPCGHLQTSEEAVAFCEECSEFYCLKCKGKHLAMKMTMDHSLLTIEDYIEQKKYENVTLCGPCQYSGIKEEAIYYCTDCPDPEPLCDECASYHKATKGNRNHKLSKKIEQLQDVFNKMKTENDNDGNDDAVLDETQVNVTGTDSFKSENRTTISNVETRSGKAPGKPVARDVKCDRIILSWTPAPDFQEGDYYQIRYKAQTERKWRFSDEQPSVGTIEMTYLKADTIFVFQVRVVHNDIEGPYSPISDEVHTRESHANRLFSFSNKVRPGPPGVYKLPVVENKGARNTSAKTRKYNLGVPPTQGREKTIMLVGATGTGKSTLVDGIVNYVLGVNWGDTFRYTLVDLENEEETKVHNQAISQTEWVTCYSINLEEGSRLNYRLNIIDTPGFGDTRGLERDQQVVEQIRQLFSAQGEQGVVFIDAVCFLIKAPDARLTATQKYIFSSIMSLFGNDIEQNICTLITFADGDDPPVLAALKEAKLPFGLWFPFNNSGLFAKNTEEGAGKSSLSPMFWEMGQKSFRSLFCQIENMQTKSLQLTKEVLERRQRLELTIQNLQLQVDAGLNKLNELKAELQILDKHKTEIEANKDFTYTVPETKQVIYQLPAGQHVTNCLNCHVTCHINCFIPNDADKRNCRAMDVTGHCTQCSEKCFWNQHANTPYIFQYVTEKVTKTYAEKLEKYRQARGEKMTREKVVQRMEEELHDLEEDIQKMMMDVKECNEILQRIALRPNPLSMVEHLDLMIEAEKMEKKSGFQERIKTLHGFRKRAEIGKDVDRFHREVSSAREQHYGTTLATAALEQNTAAVTRKPGPVKKAMRAFKSYFK